MKSLKELKIAYLTVHLSSGLTALKVLKKEVITLLLWIEIAIISILAYQWWLFIEECCYFF